MNVREQGDILLAIDVSPGEPAWHFAQAIDMVRELVRDRADHVVVFHVREFSVGRLIPMMTDRGGAGAKHAVEAIVSVLRAVGVNASSQVREADAGHVARTILDSAHEFGARMIVLGKARHQMPLGSVAQHLALIADMPLVIVAGSDNGGVARGTASLVNAR